MKSFMRLFRSLASIVSKSWSFSSLSVGRQAHQLARASVKVSMPEQCAADRQAQLSSLVDTRTACLSSAQQNNENPYPAHNFLSHAGQISAPHEHRLSRKDVLGVLTVDRSQAPLLQSGPLDQLRTPPAPGSPLLPPSFLQNFSTSLQTLGWAFTSFSYLMLSFPRKSNLI